MGLEIQGVGPEKLCDCRGVDGLFFEHGIYEGDGLGWCPVVHAAIEPEVKVGGSEGSALVAVEEGMVLEQTLHQGCRLLDGSVVVAGLGSENGGLQCAEVSNTLGASEIVDHGSVDRDDLDHGEVLVHAIGRGVGRARDSGRWWPSGG